MQAHPYRNAGEAGIDWSRFAAGVLLRWEDA